jgi:hypothetical protein
MQRVKQNEQDHSQERMERTAKKKKDLTGPAFLEMSDFAFIPPAAACWFCQLYLQAGISIVTRDGSRWTEIVYLPV